MIGMRRNMKYEGDPKEGTRYVKNEK